MIIHNHKYQNIQIVNKSHHQSHISHNLILMIKYNLILKILKYQKVYNNKISCIYKIILNQNKLISLFNQLRQVRAT